MDPRVKTLPLALKQQYDLSMQAYDGIAKARSMANDVRGLISDLEKNSPNSPSLAKLRTILNGPQQRPGTATVIAGLPLARLAGAFTQMLDLLQDADVAPTTQAVAAARDLQTAMAKVESAWTIEKAKIKTGFSSN